jgi:hypothetical protein
MDSAVSLKPPKLLPRSHWSRRSHFRGLIETAESASTASLKLRKRLPRSHWDCWSRQFQMIISNFSAISQPYAKWLLPVNQGPRGCWLMKKTEGRKSRDTFSLNDKLDYPLSFVYRTYFSSIFCYFQWRMAVQKPIFSFLSLYRFVFLFRFNWNTETRINQNKQLDSDSVETSFGSSFVCFES